MPLIIMVIVFGIGLVVGPIVLMETGHALGFAANVISMVSGALFLIVGVGIAAYKKLYVMTDAANAFVRTGNGKPLVVIDGGSFVISFMHKIAWITLETLRIEVEKNGEHSLYTSDSLLADIKALFFVCVNKEKESVGKAAAKFQGGLKNSKQVSDIIGEKLEDALRTVAAKMTLRQLINDRATFLKEVTEILRDELEPNGLQLEGASITTLNQADYNLLKDNDIIHSEGKKKIAEVVQANLTRVNELERNGEQDRKEQDVKTAKEILTFEQDEASAKARQEAEVKVIQANQMREAEERRIEAERQVELADVQKLETVQVAAERQKQQVEIAERARLQAVAVADQQKLEAETNAQKEVEVAQRAKLQAVAAAEQEVASAETLKAQAEAEREKARQSIETVTVVETAGRLKRQEVIQAEAAAEKNYVTAQRDADAKAYGIKKNAEARKEAADADAEAVRKKAEAEKDAELARAEGLRAKELVPVQVEAERVTVAQRNVEQVIKPELEARKDHGKIAQDFELAKLQINADMQVRIETAKAAVSIGNNVEIKAFTTLDQMNDMTSKMMSGLGLSEKLNGFVDGIEADTVRSALNGLSVLKGTVGRIAEKVGLSEETLASKAPVVVDQTSDGVDIDVSDGGNSSNNVD